MAKKRGRPEGSGIPSIKTTLRFPEQLWSNIKQYHHYCTQENQLVLPESLNDVVVRLIATHPDLQAFMEQQKLCLQNSKTS